MCGVLEERHTNHTTQNAEAFNLLHPIPRRMGRVREVLFKIYNVTIGSYIFKVNLSQTRVMRKEPQLKDCLDHIGLWACVQGTVFIVN